MLALDDLPVNSLIVLGPGLGRQEPRPVVCPRGVWAAAFQSIQGVFSTQQFRRSEGWAKARGYRRRLAFCHSEGWAKARGYRRRLAFCHSEEWAKARGYRRRPKCRLEETEAMATANRQQQEVYLHCTCH